MEPTVVAIVADVNTPVFGPKLVELVNDAGLTAIAKVIVANDAAQFVSDFGADTLAKVTVLVVGVFAGGKPQVVADLWSSCPNVKWIHSLAAGVDSLVPVLRPLPRIAEVPVTNAKGAFSRSLAEYALMAMLHFNKQVPRCQQNKQEKKWEKFLMSELHGMTVGFVGFGDIAQTTVPLCRAFGMKVLALRRNKGGATDKGQADETLGIDNAEERLALFQRSDFVVCSLPGTPETKHFCGAKEFAAMKETAVFISMGRGVCVDEAALCDALKSGSIAGAALDVYEVEPLPEAAAVWDAPNLLMTSHNADLTKTYIEDTWVVFLEKLRAFRSAPQDFKGTVSIEHGY
eukprot:TRINITY_DN83843_c0_g1_i1.p1 TRINITY_DN83843_c0_g1~~TRINITY_DN83843_c0_g1_i1.p1  ORF type:complete len:369 (+),score=104.93 TRINITY_DN83843_c0_g1_i1:75-1109(+)